MEPLETRPVPLPPRTVWGAVGWPGQQVTRLDTASSVVPFVPPGPWVITSSQSCLPFCSLSHSEGDSDVDSELEDRVDGVKSWLSKNKGPSKAASDDGSLKSSR